LTSLTPALAPQLGLLGSPPDPVGRFTMREGPSNSIVSRRLAEGATKRDFCGLVRVSQR